RTKLKTIFYKLLIFGKYRSFYNFIAAISFVVKKWMTNVLHVNTDLMRAPRFQPAFYQCYVIESFEHFKMGNGFFPMIAFRICSKNFPESLMASYMRNNGSFLFLKISPH